MGSVSVSDNAANRLEGKVGIITGGASGIGESTVKLFVKQGASVVIADIQDAIGHALCDEINKLQGSDAVSYMHCNVTSDEDVKRVVDFTVTKYGKLDIMYSNAGIAGDVTWDILGTNNANFKNVFEVNVYGAFLCAKEAARVMIPARKGVLLFTSSVTALVAGDGPHAYGVSKHALVGLMKSLCAELGEYGIRVNCVSPCSIATPLLRNKMSRTKSFIDSAIHESGVLKGVVPQPEDIAEAALYLVSDEAKYVSGMNLVVDGGYSVANKSFTTVMGKMMRN